VLLPDATGTAQAALACRHRRPGRRTTGAGNVRI